MGSPVKENIDMQTAPGLPGNIKVLYCEDTALSRLKISRFLGEKVSNLYIAEDGLTGLELFEKHHPDLVITDIGMPGMDGISMCKAIREISPDVPIIIVSVHEKPEYLHAAIKLSVYKYVNKPFNLDELLNDIEAIATDLQKHKLIESKLAIAENLVHKELQKQEQNQGLISTRFRNIQRLGLIRRISIPKNDFNRDAHIVVQYKDSIYLLVTDGAHKPDGNDSLSAEMLTLQLPKIFKSLAEEGRSLSGIAKVLNNILLEQFTGYLVAATLVRINPKENIIEVLNCNNPAVLLLDSNYSCLHEFESKADPLGTVMNEGDELEVETTPCHEDAYLYVFTDGLTGALQVDSAVELSQKLFQGAEDSDVLEHIEHLVKDATSSGQNDDITLLEIPCCSNSVHENIILPALEQRVSRDKLLSYIDEHFNDFVKNTVLYIGCDEETINLLGQLFANNPANFLLVTDKAEALQRFVEQSPSIVIADIKLLKLTDPCLIDEIHKINPATAILLINDSREIMGSPINMPCFGESTCVNRPLNIGNLFQAMECGLKNSNEQQHINLSASTYFFTSLAMTITDRNKQIVSVNPAFCRITGYSPEEVIGRTPRILSSGKHDAEFYRQMWHSIDSKSEWSGEIWNRRKNGDLFLEWININAISDDDGEATHYFSVFADITERKAGEEAIRKLTFHDPLTDLPNRRLFLDSLEKEIKKAERHQQLLAVLFVDIDNLKDVNDTLGHDCGDKVIIETAKRLKACVRDTDTVGRFGGDEFTVCLTELKSIGNADTVAQHILKQMTAPILLNEDQFYLSVSIGIAMYPDDAKTIVDLLKHADQAMFSAKFSGRNRVRYFDISMQEQAIARKEIIKDLRIAIGSDQLTVYYQPIVDMASGEAHKAEALIRWEHPEHGFVSPEEFIPIAEDTGMITEIGDWVFRQAALQAKKWQIKYDKDLQISINKSPKQFHSDQHSREDWINFLTDIDLPKSSIVVEITEGLLMDTNIANTRQLLMFRDAGIQVALDDFGTGYSSLAYLKKFDIDFIKIDQSFVQNLEHSEDEQALCEAIIVMAHKLGIKVIAEGIETEQQRDILSMAGCDYGQGYFFSRPLPAEKFEKMLKQNYS